MLPEVHSRDSEKSTFEVCLTDTKIERELIRAQLARILESPLFANSKRYPALLRYVVEKTLDGQADGLKERTVGVDVFGREPHYDTNVDHVVRSSAAEVRKRLAQYYLEPAHASELRIELPAGCYVPHFRTPAAPGTPCAPAPEVPEVAAREPQPRSWLRYLVAAVVFLCACAGFLLMFPQKTALNRFWDPVLNSSAPLALCVGEGDFPALREWARRERDHPLTVADIHNLQSERISFHDSITLMRLSSFLTSRNARYEFLFEPATTLDRLRKGPSVLIGAFDNDWSIRLTRNLRFSFGSGPDASVCSYIRDQQNPAKKNWSVCWNQPYLELTDDYALVTRVRDPTTEQMVVVAAGLGRDGTMAAGEFLTNPVYMEELERQAPPGWDGMNMQAVINTKVMRGSSGPPRLLTTYFW